MKWGIDFLSYKCIGKGKTKNNNNKNMVKGIPVNPLRAWDTYWLEYEEKKKN